MAHILPLRGKKPRVAAETFLAPTAVLIGDIRIGSGASVWFGAVLRADDPEHPIIVGSGAMCRTEPSCMWEGGDLPVLVRG